MHELDASFSPQILHDFSRGIEVASLALCSLGRIHDSWCTCPCPTELRWPSAYSGLKLGFGTERNSECWNFPRFECGSEIGTSSVAQNPPNWYEFSFSYTHQDSVQNSKCSSICFHVLFCFFCFPLVHLYNSEELAKKIIQKSLNGWLSTLNQ